MLTSGFLKHSCFILLKGRMVRDGIAALMSARELMLWWLKTCREVQAAEETDERKGREWRKAGGSKSNGKVEHKRLMRGWPLFNKACQLRTKAVFVWSRQIKGRRDGNVVRTEKNAKWLLRRRIIRADKGRDSLREGEKRRPGWEIRGGTMEDNIEVLRLWYGNMLLQSFNVQNMSSWCSQYNHMLSTTAGV